MSRRQLFCLVVAVFVSISQRVTADQDLIGPIAAVLGQPIDIFFPNRVLPQPSVKILQFVGEWPRNSQRNIWCLQNHLWLENVVTK